MNILTTYPTAETVARRLQDKARYRAARMDTVYGSLATLAFVLAVLSVVARWLAL